MRSFSFLANSLARTADCALIRCLYIRSRACFRRFFSEDVCDIMLQNKKMKNKMNEMMASDKAMLLLLQP
jgi:uncharacterized protein with von Willebrand factor type A (vWA) domain